MYYYQEPYKRAVKAKIVKKEDGKYLLDKTILYEGGGGQPPDVGFVLCNGEEKRIVHTGNLWHEIDCNLEGEIEMMLDWNFRYEMMKSHTAEHAFFRFLQNKGAELVKISLGEESSIIFKGDIEIEDIIEAEENTRELISEGREVRTFWIEKNKANNFPELRIKKERIKGDKIRIVEIVNHDLSACKGIHVKNLKEIEDFAVVRFRKGKKKEVKFIVGNKAKKFHYKMSRDFRRLLWKHEIESDKFEKYLDNLLYEREVLFSALKSLSNEMPFIIKRCGDLEILFRIIPGADRKTMVRRMMELTKEKGKIAIFGDPISHSISCAFSEELKQHKQEAIKILKELGGKGGGGERFISGYIPDPEEFIEKFKEKICKTI